MRGMRDRHPLFDLHGRTALITGSSQGIGFALARGLAGAGAAVVLNGRDPAKLSGAADALRSTGARVATAAFDVTVSGSITEALARLDPDFAAIDILVNNAGIHRRAALAEMTEPQWREVIDTNLTSAFLVTRALVAGMIERGHGKIVNVCSLMSEVGRPTTGNYAAAKGGLKMLTRAMTVEWARHNLQINGIGPGYIATELTAPLRADAAFDQWIKGRTPAGRWGLPEELVGAAIFLASPASGFVNGQVIYVDGGLLAAI